MLLPAGLGRRGRVGRRGGSGAGDVRSSSRQGRLRDLDGAVEPRVYRREEDPGTTGSERTATWRRPTGSGAGCGGLRRRRGQKLNEAMALRMDGFGRCCGELLSCMAWQVDLQQVLR